MADEHKQQVAAYLLARPQIDEAGIADVFGDLGSGWRRSAAATPAEEIVEFAGRICYLSFGARQSPRSNEAYVANLIDQEHESVLEHVSWTFLLCGVSRAFTHQLVRHRVGFAYSQLSQQYHDESEADFVEPSNLHLTPKAEMAWKRAIRAARQAYREIQQSLSDETPTEPGRDRKERQRAIRSAARSILPNATETKIVVTANARAIRHFLDVRGAILGDEEMRIVSAVILNLMKQEAPALFADFEVVDSDDGLPIVKRTLRRTPEAGAGTQVAG